MKQLALLFSIYMAFLTLMPCQDKEECSATSELVSSIQKPATETTHSGQEICPPFCTCSCCAVWRDFIQPKAYGIIVPLIQSQYAVYRMPAIPEQFLEIYQPPQEI